MGQREVLTVDEFSVRSCTCAIISVKEYWNNHGEKLSKISVAADTRWGRVVGWWAVVRWGILTKRSALRINPIVKV